MSLRVLHRLGFQDLFVTLSVCAVLLVQLTSFAADPGVGWHLKTGEWIAQHHTVPAIDPFLAGSAPRSWVADQWLSDLLIYSLYSAGSWALVYAVLVSLFLAIFFLMLYPVARRESYSAFAAALSTLLFFKVAQIHLILRPVVFGIFCFAGCYLLCRRWADQRAPLGIVDSCALLALFIVWANLHPSFVLGLVVVAIALFARIRRDGGRGAIFSTAFALLLLAATGLNPNGIELHRSILWLGSSSYFMQLHEEWRALDLQSFEGVLVELFMFFTVLALYLRGSRTLQWSTFEVLTLLAFTHAALSMVRMLPFLAVVGCVPFAKALGPLWNEGSSRFSALLRRIDRHESGSFGGREIAAAALMLIVGSALLFKKLPGYAGAYGPPAATFPYQAVAALKLDADSGVVLSNPQWGGFIVFEGGPNWRPIIDDRNTLLGEEFYRRFFAELKPEADWRAFLKEFGVTHAVLPLGSPLGSELKRNGAVLLYHDSIAETLRLIL